MKNIKVFASLIIMAFTVISCASVGNDTLREETEENVAAKIKEGFTTKSQIKQMYGSPITTNYTDGGLEIWKYEFTRTHVKASSFVPIVGLFSGGQDGTKKELTILFDENDLVKKFNMSESDVELRSGFLH